MDKLMVAGVIIFFLWLFFGGMLEDQSQYDRKNTVSVDCDLPGWKNQPICNGEYEDQMEQDEAAMDQLYPN